MNEPGPPSHTPTGDQAPHVRASNVVLFNLAQGVSSVGTWMHKTAVGWLTWELTHAPAWVGAMAATELIAALWVAPLAGALADRRSAYDLLRVTQILMLLQALVLGGLTAAGQMSIWLLFFMSLLDATLQGFNQPVRMTATALLAGRERLAQAIAGNSVAFNLARTVGPAFAGALLLGGGAALVFFVNAASFLAMLGAVLYLRPWLARPAVAPQAPLIQTIVDGFAYVARTPRIAALFLMAATFSLFARPFAELVPAFAGQVFNGGPKALSMLLSAQGAGALVGALWMLRRRGAEKLPVMVYAMGLGLCLTLLVFTSTRDLALAVPVMAVAGLFHVVCNISMQSLAQLDADDAYKGRVMGLYGLLFRCLPATGAFAIGVAAHWAPLQALVGAGAAAAAVIIVVLAWKARRI